MKTPSACLYSSTGYLPISELVGVGTNAIGDVEDPVDVGGPTGCNNLTKFSAFGETWAGIGLSVDVSLTAADDGCSA